MGDDKDYQYNHQDLLSSSLDILHASPCVQPLKKHNSNKNRGRLTVTNRRLHFS